jgi:trans-aconitate methyltransferase
MIDEPDSNRPSGKPVVTPTAGSYYPTMALAAEQIVDLYERHARDFDQERGRSLWEKAWLDRFLALLPTRASLLDIGCGCGEPIARYLLERNHTVTGIDSSATLIEMCRSRFPEQEWIVSDMRELSLDRVFQGLLAWNSYFHLCPDDQRCIFPIFRMHAAPGAALLFTSGPGHGEAIGTWHGEPLYHGSLDEAEYRALLAQNGFSVVSHIVEDPSCGQHTVWLAQLG